VRKIFLKGSIAADTDYQVIFFAKVPLKSVNDIKHAEPLLGQC